MALKKQSCVLCLVSCVARVTRILLVLFLLTTHDARHTTALASVRQEVYVTGTVQSFGGYKFSGGVRFLVTEPGKQALGTIVVDGLYNGPYPWTMRVYTDNLHFEGIAGSARRPKPAGLVSTDGQYVIPLEIHSPYFGPGVWRRIPDINEPNPVAYSPAISPGEPADGTECIILGIDPRNANWVAGPDGLLFTRDDNILGDVTVAPPFEFTLQGDLSGEAVMGEYETYLYIETVPAP